MILFLSALAILMVIAAAVTVYAVLTAKDGFENETGFHVAPVLRPYQETETKMANTIPPFAAAN